MHTGGFHSVTRGAPLAGLPFVNATYGAGRGIFCEQAGLVYCADSRTSTLHALDLAGDREVWRVALPNRQGGAVGPIAARDGRIVSWGNDLLGTYEPMTGERVDSFELPGMGVLEPPFSLDGDLLFVWSTPKKGGLLRFDPASGAVRWTFTKKGRLSSTTGGLVVVGRTAVLSVNGGSTLVGVDVESGEERWRFRAQWLYTPLVVDGASMVFGTSGGHGSHLRRHDVATGETEWEVKMKNGCPHFTQAGDDLFAGDWAGVLRRVRLATGEVADAVKLGEPICTAPLVVGRDVYAFRWCKRPGRPALVALAV
ncbi:MAG: PQQ-binding-like beta-propeller repeat protein [Polyangiaceae bacterium]